METWGVSELEVSPPEQACAAFFCSLVIELSVPKEPVKRQDALKLAYRWLDASAICRSAINEPGRPGTEPELARALSAVAEYLKEYAQFIIESANRSSPHLLKRSSGQRNDDASRAVVRAMAVGSHAIFGKYLYGTLATIAAVTLDADVDAESVRNWCADLPCH
jgi:hypothetical protein